MKRLSTALGALALATLTTLAPATYAQDYPSKPVRITVGMAPGGSNDTIARLIGAELQERLSQPFIVENKPGANSTIATAELKNASPDGYNLMLVISSHVTNTMLYPNLNYALGDFKAVTIIADTPFVLVANPKFPPNNVGELMKYVEKSKDLVAFGTPGMGSTQHIAMELMNQMGKMEMNHIPYKGGAPAQMDLIAGVIPLIFATPTQSLPAIRAGQVKAIGVTSEKRIPQLPDVPTLAESGLPGYEANVWFGVVAPAKTPDNIIKFLNKEIVEIVKSDKVQAKLKEMGLNPVGSTSEQFQALLDNENTKWANVIKSADIKLQ
ncbi:MAG: Bug family tripartite tricarboxylate transporter substrate binding protein [Burkholderiaceae bacterium]|jgi:tripartite-type tricarboxylate transporter receptor subunit TctC